MPGVKTNERPGTRAVLRHCRMSAFKVRQVLDLIRGVEYQLAREILLGCERGAADVVLKLLDSAASNAEHNDDQAREELYVSACYADEGRTFKRYRGRARGRTDRIYKRACHITVIVSRLPEEELRRRRAKAEAELRERRARRVAGTRRSRRVAGEAAARSGAAAARDHDHDHDAEILGAEIDSSEELLVDVVEGDEVEADDIDADDIDADDGVDADEDEETPVAAGESDQDSTATGDGESEAGAGAAAEEES